MVRNDAQSTLVNGEVGNPAAVGYVRLELRVERVVDNYLRLDAQPLYIANGCLVTRQLGRATRFGQYISS